jgi:hypothetical protein
MEEKKKRCCCRNKKQESKAGEEYPGVAINQADDNKVSKNLVKERTETLNNNPRNTD